MKIRATEVEKATKLGHAPSKRDLFEVLKELGPLPVNELYRRAGYREEKPSEVEEFYRLLQVAHSEKRVIPVPDSEPDRVILKAVTR